MTKVHRILKSKQFDWLKIYFDFNTDRRENAANSFEKDFFKLMNKVFIVKQWKMRGKKFVILIISAKDYKKYVSKSSFISQKIICENVFATHETKPVLTLHKPIYVGFSILDLSK